METRNTPNPSKDKGFAIRGLKAYIKSLELAEGSRISQRKYRYEIAEDGLSARITTAADSAEVEGTNKSISDWAAIGRPARLGLIGLRAKREELMETGARVLYTLDVRTGEACLTSNGEPVAELPTTIEEWAKIGREVEKPLYDALKRHQQSRQIALDYSNAEAVAEEDGNINAVKAKMERYGIIRAQRPASEDGSASEE